LPLFLGNLYIAAFDDIYYGRGRIEGERHLGHGSAVLGVQALRKSLEFTGEPITKTKSALSTVGARGVISIEWKSRRPLKWGTGERRGILV